MINNVRKLIGEGCILEAITQLKNLSTQKELDEQFINEVVVLEFRYNEIQKGKRLGIASDTSFSEQENKIVYSLLASLDHYKTKIITSDYKQMNKPRSKVEIILDQNIEEFDLKRIEDLVRLIAAFLEIDKDGVKIKGVVSGSVIIYLEIPTDKVNIFKGIIEVDNNRIASILIEDFALKKVNSLELELSLNTTSPKLTPEQEKIFWSLVTSELSRKLSLLQDSSDWGENERNTINKALNREIKAAYKKNAKVASLCNLYEKEILQGKIDARSFIRRVLIDKQFNTTRNFNKHRFSFLLIGKPASDFIFDKHVLQHTYNSNMQLRMHSGVKKSNTHKYFISERQYKARRLINKLNEYKDQKEVKDFLVKFQEMHKELVLQCGVEGNIGLVVEIYTDIYDLAKETVLKKDDGVSPGKSIFEEFGGRGFYLRDESVVSRVNEYLGLNENVEKQIEAFKKIEEKTEQNYLEFYEEVLVEKRM